MTRKWIALLMMALSASGWSAQPRGPWHEQVSGEPTVEVQYVHLIGHEINPEETTTQMRKTYDACSDGFRTVGLPVAPPPSNGFPPFEHTFNIDTYYAPGRTAVYSHHTYTYVDYRADCAVVTSNFLNLSIFDNFGTCEINLAHHEGGGCCQGRCPKARRAQRQQPESAPEQAIDWERLPEPTRTQLKKLQEVRARMAKSTGMTQAHTAWPSPAPAPTGARKTIAGVNCAIYEIRFGPNVAFRYCATDAHSIPPPMKDIVPSYLARTLPGVVLEADTPPSLHKLATQFDPKLKVSPAVFEIPPGTRFLTENDLKQ